MTYERPRPRLCLHSFSATLDVRICVGSLHSRQEDQRPVGSPSPSSHSQTVDRSTIEQAPDNPLAEMPSECPVCPERRTNTRSFGAAAWWVVGGGALFTAAGALWGVFPRPARGFPFLV